MLSPMADRTVKGEVKRSHSPTSDDGSSTSPSPTASRKKTSAADQAAQPPSKRSKTASSTFSTSVIDWKDVEGWTPDKRAAFLERIIAAGVSAIGSPALCEEFGLTKFQVNNAISAGKKNNLRVKAIQAVRGE